MLFKYLSSEARCLHYTRKIKVTLHTSETEGCIATDVISTAYSGGSRFEFWIGNRLFWGFSSFHLVSWINSWWAITVKYVKTNPLHTPFVSPVSYNHSSISQWSCLTDRKPRIMTIRYFFNDATFISAFKDRLSRIQN